jgi:hypothetical protein
MLRREPVANIRAMNFGDSLRLTLANQMRKNVIEDLLD